MAPDTDRDTQVYIITIRNRRGIGIEIWVAGSGPMHNLVRSLMDSWEANILCKTSALRTAYLDTPFTFFRGCEHLLHIIVTYVKRKSCSSTYTATSKLVPSPSLL